MRGQTTGRKTVIDWHPPTPTNHHPASPISYSLMLHLHSDRGVAIPCTACTRTCTPAALARSHRRWYRHHALLSEAGGHLQPEQWARKLVSTRGQPARATICPARLTCQPGSPPGPCRPLPSTAGPSWLVARPPPAQAPWPPHPPHLRPPPPPCPSVLAACARPHTRP